MHANLLKCRTQDCSQGIVSEVTYQLTIEHQCGPENVTSSLMHVQIPRDVCVRNIEP